MRGPAALSPLCRALTLLLRLGMSLCTQGIKIKGGVGIVLPIDGKLTCFMSAHLDASSEKERNENIDDMMIGAYDFAYTQAKANWPVVPPLIPARTLPGLGCMTRPCDPVIEQGCKFGGRDCKPTAHSLQTAYPGGVYVMGDLNYRIGVSSNVNENTVDYVAGLFVAGDWAKLKERDQLQTCAADKGFKKYGFKIPPLGTATAGMPTYKREYATLRAAFDEYAPSEPTTHRRCIRCSHASFRPPPALARSLPPRGFLRSPSLPPRSLSAAPPQIRLGEAAGNAFRGESWE